MFRNKREKIRACGIRTDTLSLEDTQLNQQTIWTIAWLWLLCFDKDIFAYNESEIEKVGNFMS